MQQQMNQGQFSGQQSPMQQTGVQMKEPPAVVTTKDLAYLKDAMSWELLAAKKFAHWAAETQDPQAKSLLEKAGAMHHRHYDLLLSNVDPNKTI